MAVFFCEGNIVNIKKLEFELDQKANEGNELFWLVQIDLGNSWVDDAVHLAVVYLIFNLGGASIVIGVVSFAPFFNALQFQDVALNTT